MLVDYPLGTAAWCRLMFANMVINLKIIEIDKHADALGIRITVGSFIVLGQFERMRDMLSSALTHWTEDMEFYPYILGL